jgi:hypothetical protein
MPCGPWQNIDFNGRLEPGHMRVYIGQDNREQQAFEVAERSLLRHSPTSIITPISLDRLAAAGLLRRPMDRRGNIYDIHSNAPCSTEFAISRFLAPILCQSGWCLFTDCDVVFLEDVDVLLRLADPDRAVMVVKHKQPESSAPKMDGQQQVAYARKNWSSVALWNCDHVANRRLSIIDVNERPGRDLHAFYWLHDDEIGELPAKWNWLVGVQEKPENPAIAHFTLGTPDMVQNSPHADIWFDALK